MQNKVNLKRLQKRNFNHGELTDLKINDIFTYLSIDEKTNNEVAEEFDNATFDSDFENEYFGDIDEENVIHDSEDENGEDFEEKEMIEEDLCEEQILFGNEFFNMESSTMSTRDYDEIIDHRNDLHLPADKYRNSKKSMTDIQDGHVYTNILHSLENERQSKFISLTCNIDGAAVYTSSEQSMWTFTACINELKRTIRFSIENIIDKKTHSCGYAGESEFTSLAFVDRGTSFMSDTLHTIYHGAFKKLLLLWTESSNKQPWSIARFLPLINLDLQNIRYPSTTTRAPRTFGICIGESRNISPENINEMELLLSSFVDNFPYPERYIVQNIHSVKHFATTAKDFGPLFNYSTFNFENIIGYLSASVHGTKRLDSELLTNLQLFQQTYFASKTHCSSSNLSTFIEYLETKKNHCRQQQISSEYVSKDDLELLYTSIPKESTVKTMKSSKA
ncbi:unnamed protein product [Rotaria sordida]|uniref:Uncharacterized protein n=1 Tax=Rotaria sordida TaxID=392033 RepID=A0A819HGV1_9BILA|nr:unnamed protein product [Rotaria sordida]